jgi:hypothetical protein
MTPRGPTEDRAGFVLALVVLMLFAIAMAAAAGYVAVRTEFTLAKDSREGLEALTVARGGLQRFLGEQVGVVGDSVSYAIGNGVATVTSRRVFEKDSLDYLYFIRSEGSVTDPRYPTNPAKRVVGAYAWQHLSPVPHKAAVMAAMSTIDISGWYYSIHAYVNGYDHATTSDCPGGGTAGVAGGIGVLDPTTSYGGTQVGNPAHKHYASTAAVIDSAGIRWDILSNPSFPVEFDGSPPNFTSLPSDSFPLVRYIGDLNAGSSWAGRGVLIVTGTLTMQSGFVWNGIVLAGDLGNVSYAAAPTVNGLLIGGLNGTDTYVRFQSGFFYYNSCYVYAADRALSYLDPVDNTVFEID